PEAIPVYLLLSNRVNSLRLIPLVSSLIDTYWLLVCDRPVIDYNNSYGVDAKIPKKSRLTHALPGRH
ncbi:hypothetical protein LC609_28545, partial [Nostoc sp. XA013]|nr:hypothetical protein [Nostoc sp. XA013]